MASYGYTFTSGDTVTPTKLNNARTVSDIVNADISATAAIAATKLASDSITNTQIKSDAAIALSKLATGALPSAITVASANLTYDNGPTSGFRNRLINGDFRLAQRGTSFTSTNSANNDDTYNLDRWYVLSDGNDSVDITQTTSEVPTNGYAAIALDVETVNKKFGIAQIIEQQNCIGLIGGNVTLSFKAKVSSTTKLDNIKAAIVAWSGTADTVTSDIVSAWGAEGTNPTLIANTTYENTPANLSVTTSYATYTLTANVDTASTKNIIVFIWSDVTDTTLGDFLYITDVQLEAGTVATPFEARPIGTELALCQRYYWRGGYGWNGLAHNSTNGVVTGVFPVKMRGNPTINGIAGLGGNALLRAGGSTETINSSPNANANTNGGWYAFAGGGYTTANLYWLVTDLIEASAEL